MVFKKYQSLFWILIFGGILGFHAWSLMRFPAPFVDEVWVTSRAWAFRLTGIPFGPLDRGLLERFDHYWISNQWLFTFIQSLFLEFSRRPSLLPTRIQTLVFGVFLLVINAWTANRLRGRQVALWSTLLLSLSMAFIYSAHLARYDMVTAVFGYLSLALYLDNPKSRWWKAFLSGLVLGLGLDIHFNIAIFFPVLGVLYLVDEGWKFYTLPKFWWFIAGGAVALVYFTLMRIIPNPETFQLLNRLLFATTRQPPIIAGPAVILNSLGYTLTLIGGALSFMVFLLPFSIYKAIKSRVFSHSRILIISLVLILGFILVVPTKPFFYTILITPPLLWLVADFLVDFFSQQWVKGPRPVLTRSAVLACCVFFVFSSLSMASLDEWKTYNQLQALVDQHVKTGDKILGAQTYWLGLYNHYYYSWENLYYYSRFYPGQTVEDAFKAFEPDIFILDEQVRSFLIDIPSGVVYQGGVDISREGVNAVLEKHGELVLDQEIPDYGRLQIYRLRWDNTSP